MLSVHRGILSGDIFSCPFSGYLSHRPIFCKSPKISGSHSPLSAGENIERLGVIIVHDAAVARGRRLGMGVVSCNRTAAAGSGDHRVTGRYSDTVLEQIGGRIKHNIYQHRVCRGRQIMSPTRLPV